MTAGIAVLRLHAGDGPASPALTGDLAIGEAGERLFGLLLETASGKRSARERNGFGDLEFVPWQPGAVR